MMLAMSITSLDRRDFLKHTAMGAAAVGTGGGSTAALAAAKPKKREIWRAPLFKLSLAQWSLHRTLSDKKLDNLDFARQANTLGFDAIEYVNRFFADRAKDRSYLAELKKRAQGEGVWSALIMVDGEGDLGDPDAVKRTQAIENHRKWLEAAAYLGCHSIRVNARSAGPEHEQVKVAADGLHRLAELGDAHGLNVLVENHGGLSSNGAWLASVMKTAAHPRAGTLPDFGNFRVSDTEEYDRYKGVEELMPFARGVSAKSHDFGRGGNETNTDYLRMMKIVLAAGYHGYVGVEYEGKTLPEIDGILATKRLLERVRAKLGTQQG